MNWRIDVEGVLEKIWNVQRPSRLERNIWKREMFEEGKKTFEEGLKAQKQETNERCLCILILTIRIHSEDIELSIRKRAMGEVVMTIWSQNGCQ